MPEDKVKYVNFIREIIRQTKENKLVWNYLDKNKDLYEGMGWVKKVKSSFFFSTQEDILPNFNDEDSYYSKIDDVFVVIYVQSNNPAKLYVVPNTYKKIVVLTADEYGEYITHLLNIVQSQFPDATTFINSFLNGKKDN